MVQRRVGEDEKSERGPEGMLIERKGGKGRGEDGLKETTGGRGNHVGAMR